MSTKISISSEAIGYIVDFYRIQPKLNQVSIEKIEEYLLVMNSHYSESIADLDEISDAKEELCLNDLMDILNSYLSLVGEELSKIFKDESHNYTPINFYSKDDISEVQLIELLRKFNGGEADLFQMNGSLNQIEAKVYDQDFALALVNLIENLITQINAELVVRVDDLI